MTEPVAKTFAQKVEGSSQVKRIRYLPELHLLQVVFKSTPQFCYTYLAFPPEAWERLQAADSVGSFLIKNVTRPQLLGADSAPVLPYPFGKAAIGLEDDAWADTEELRAVIVGVSEKKT